MLLERVNLKKIKVELKKSILLDIMVKQCINVEKNGIHSEII